MATTQERTRAELVAHSGCLSPQAASLLSEMYCASRLPGEPDGALVEVDQTTRIRPRQGAALHRLIRDSGAVSSLEIGLAYGFSTVWLLDALSPQAGASHAAIDPWQGKQWGGVGVQAARRMDSPVAFEWVSERSDFALTSYAKRNVQFDFIYIDGAHRFDDVLVDFYLSDQVLRSGGIIAFDDLWMPSIRAVMAFITSNRAYESVRTAEPNLGAFRKLRADDRDWEHFVPFRAYRFRSLRNRLLRLLGR